MPPSLLSSALGKAVLESIKNISLAHLFPFPNPPSTESSSDAAQRESGSKSAEQLQVFSDLLNQHICPLGAAIDFPRLCTQRQSCNGYVTDT